MGILQATMNKLAGQIRTAIITHPEKTYETLALEFQVSRSTICSIARQLKAETGFQRRPRKGN
jgi:hypothetical protein